ncbi:exosome component EXOSC1/CSL4-domain-containing protein [Kalaharituber pfeilii]|nr:exosome component EXOSC1/CSL4-domain-containing protein [Kalaharituber pfeilii]
MPLPQNGVAVPGQPLGTVAEYTSGYGIHVRHDGQLTSNLVGRLHVSDKTTPPTLSVCAGSAGSTNDDAHAPHAMNVNVNPTTLLPQVGSTVLCRVTRTNPRQANVAIFAVDVPISSNASMTAEQKQTAAAAASSMTAALSCPVPTSDTFPGVIRVQDVRATEKDKVRIGKSFKPGDIVRAVVISLGDQANYFLGTGGTDWEL